MNGQQDLSRYAWLSIATGIVTFTLKIGAFAVTGSVGLLSDAMESTVNIVAAVVALVALKAAARPANHRHHFGMSKAEYFSALVEGVMILVAAGLIVFAAVGHLRNPAPLSDLGVGIAIAIVASVINAGVATILIRAGRAHRSIVLIADGKHLMTDVWTSVGVVVAVGLVGLTGVERLDPIIAIVVAINILVTGLRLIGASTKGLLDAALPEAEHAQIVEILSRFQSEVVRFHAVQTREAGRQRFVSMHVLVPGSWTIAAGHDLLEAVEEAIRTALPDTNVATHIEPLEDPRSWQDQPTGGLSLPE